MLSLRTHVPADARILARRLTQMSDQVFAAVAETTMALSTQQARDILVRLARFEIEAFERARRVAPSRSREVAAYDLAREAATQETLRRVLLRDREVTRAPLRHVAQLLGVRLEKDSEDWLGLAIDATRVLLDVSEGRARREQGRFDEPLPAFRAALAELDGAALAPLPSPIQTCRSAAAPVFRGGAAALRNGVTRRASCSRWIRRAVRSGGRQPGDPG
ncbi:hypothetical protein GI374_17110 [Paracoccus sp. S-4012]|uniref:hypothetical protein n=1 Tax=Paracoccus sp. S-4012 TaxID=2665648 RepID=UPI0012B00D71|nr:hypothetical protein [Paracoccus sp. S-4012]MRX52096.1 hypothetical protein [Paracoccus sp. S-4012]